MMTRLNWGVGFLFVLIFTSSFFMTENPTLFINGLGLAIVVSGTLGAMFFSYPSADIIAAARVARNTYMKKTPSADLLVNTMMDLAVRRQHNGMLALEDAEAGISVSFLKRALGLLIDGYKLDELRDILYTEMYYFKQRRKHNERLFRHAGHLAPAFGVAGSVIGLVAMLSGIGDPEVIIRSIPLALTSTLYGIVLGNFVFIPIAENIYAKTQRELLMQKLVTDGVMAMQKEPSPYRLTKKLESFLTPAERPGNDKTFEEIREHFRNLQLDEENT